MKRLLTLILSAVLLLTGCAPAGAATDINGLLTGDGDEIVELPFDGNESTYLDGSGNFTAPITYPGNETQYLDGTGNFTTVSALRWKGVWAAPDWWDCDWQYQTPVSFNHTTVTANVTDFPALVLLDESFNFSHARADGFDLRFIDADGTTELSYERVSHDAVNELAEYHVKIPFISAETNYTISLYHGNPTAADGQNAADVWSNGYVAVYHMNDLTTSSIADSLGVNNGTKKAANEPVEAAGLVGKAQSFDGNDDYITANPLTDLTFANNNTVELYGEFANTASATAQALVSNSFLDVTYQRYSLSVQSGALRVSMDDGTTYIRKSGLVADGVHLFQSVYSGGAMSLFIDGVPQAGTSSAGPFNASRFVIGARANLAIPASMVGDELRISSVARSAEWIAATNLHLKGDALTVGTETALEYAGYQINDIVNYGNALYYCKQATSGLDAAPDVNTDDWQLMLTGVAP